MRHSATVVVVPLCAGLAQGASADTKVILPKGAAPNAGWSYGILVDGTLCVSGMGGEDAAGKIPSGFEAEMKLAGQHQRRAEGGRHVAVEHCERAGVPH